MKKKLLFTAPVMIVAAALAAGIAAATGTSVKDFGGARGVNAADPINAQDLVTKAYLAASGAGGVTSVGATAPIASSGGATPTISLNNSGVSAGSCTNCSLTVDAHGLLTAQSSGTAPDTGTVASGQVVFGTGAHTLSSDTYLLWDNAAKKLDLLQGGAGTSPDANAFGVFSGASSVNAVAVQNTDATARSNVAFYNDSGTLGGEVGYSNAVGRTKILDHSASGWLELTSDNGDVVLTPAGGHKVYSLGNFSLSSTYKIQGLVTGTATDEAVAGIRAINTTAGDLTGGGNLTANRTLALDTTAVTPGSYTYAGFTVDSKGRLTAAASGTAPVTSVGGTSPIASSGGTTPTISLNDTAVTPGAYTYAGFTVDQKGRLTAAASGTTPVTNVTGTAPIASSGGATPAISLNNTAVTPGSYTNTALTVDAQGRLTAASNGTAPVTSVGVSSPITTTGGSTPTIGLNVATSYAWTGIHSWTITPNVTAPHLRMSYGGPADTGMSNAESSQWQFSGSRPETWNTNATLATNRDYIFSPSTLDSSAATKTVTDAITLDITGAPSANSGNLVITRPTALYVEAGGSRLLGGVSLDATTAFSSGKIVGLTDPTAGSQEAATAHYVDAHAVSSVGVTAPITTTGGLTPTIGLDESASYSWTGSQVFTNGLTVQPIGSTSGLPIAMSIIAPTNTGITATDTDPTVQMTAGTKTWAAGAITEQYDYFFGYGTYDMASGSSTMTDGATLAIEGAPHNGGSGHLTITRPVALWLKAGGARIIGGLAMSATAALSAGKIVGLTQGTAAGEALTADRTINTTAPITGGGALTGDLTLAVSVAAPITTSGGSLGLDRTADYAWTGKHTFAPTATTGSPVDWAYTAPANTALTTTAEVIGFNVNTSANETWAAGNIATQRASVFQAPTYTITGGASTIAEAATLAVTGPPVPGSSTTITAPVAFWVQGGSSTNWAAEFDGHTNVGPLQSDGALFSVAESTSYVPTASPYIVFGHSATLTALTTWGADYRFDSNSTATFAAASAPAEADSTRFSGHRTYAIASGSATIADAATVKIESAPAAGTGITLTRPESLWVAAGGERLIGGLVMDTTTALSAGKITGLTTGTASGEAVAANRSVATGTGLSGGGDLTADRTISLANTAVTPASYTNASITVDAQGRLTAASSGTAAVSQGVWGYTSGVTISTTCVGILPFVSAISSTTTPACSTSTNLIGLPNAQTFTTIKAYTGTASGLVTKIATLYKNGSATAITCTIATSGRSCSGSGSVAFAAGDILVIGLTTGSSTTTNDMQVVVY